MPDYDYLCDTCGPFTRTRPMATFADPHPCPTCGTAAPRALLRMPALGGAEAFGPAPASDPAPRFGRHPGGCGCCAPRRLRADDGTGP
jgi:putative FmdB family regulatory protein